uniref:hypothetical protein n=1 Tax=Streptomyces sp. SAT1 TaxID=1849967 RepID=UPI0007F9ED13|nr:hypothetical protein [Streptomyces sp. SAT1]ANO42843.1 hypothetical protein A8713_037005 [Streptomyces sp. SAT1]
MAESVDRRAEAEVQAYNWARVAGGLKSAVREREAARQIMNSSSADLSAWQEWLLEHLTDERMDVDRAIALAEMWVKVATVQSTST